QRLDVRGPRVEYFARDCVPSKQAIGRYPTPTFAVLPNGGKQPGLPDGAARAISTLREHFDVIVCDLPTIDDSRRRFVGDLHDALDSLVVAVTPICEAVEAVRRAIEIDASLSPSERRSASVFVVATGDESVCELTTDELAAAIGHPVAADMP